MSNYKPIPTFMEFKGTKEKLKESNIANIKIEVSFWDEALENITSEILNNSTNGYADVWKGIVEYCKQKWQILGRDYPGVGLDEDFVRAHIKDCLFNAYADTYFCSDNDTTASYTSAKLGTKMLVFSQLSDEIYHKIRLATGQETEQPEETETKPVATVSLDNGDDYDDCDELPFESRRHVSDFRKYTELLEETKNIISASSEDSTEECLRTIKEEAGSLGYDDVLKVARNKAGKGSSDTEAIRNYIQNIIKTKIDDKEIRIDGLALKNVCEKEQNMIINSAKDLFSIKKIGEVISKIKLS